MKINTYMHRSPFLCRFSRIFQLCPLMKVCRIARRWARRHSAYKTGHGEPQTGFRVRQIRTPQIQIPRCDYWKKRGTGFEVVGSWPDAEGAEARTGVVRVGQWNRPCPDSRLSSPADTEASLVVAAKLTGCSGSPTGAWSSPCQVYN